MNTYVNRVYFKFPLASFIVRESVELRYNVMKGAGFVVSL